jgi:hypothetical protein
LALFIIGRSGERVERTQRRRKRENGVAVAWFDEARLGGIYTLSPELVETSTLRAKVNRGRKERKGKDAVLVLQATDPRGDVDRKFGVQADGSK